MSDTKQHVYEAALDHALAKSLYEAAYKREADLESAIKKARTETAKAYGQMRKAERTLIDVSALLAGESNESTEASDQEGA